MKVLDNVEALDLRKRASSCLIDFDGSFAFFNTEFLNTRNFCCLPFQGDFYDTEESVTKLCRLARSKLLQCGAITPHREDCYSITPTHEELTLVRREYVEPSYFITDNFKTFMLVSDSDYYWALAASKSLLEDVFAGPLEDIVDTFSQDFSAFSTSSDPHDLNVGRMMADLTRISKISIKRARG